MSRFVIKEATVEDDLPLRRILSANIIEGRIRLSLEKNPSFFKALAVRGKYNQVIIAREKAKIAGFGTRSIKPAFINGKLSTVGYLGDLRLTNDYRGLSLLSRGYQYFKKLHLIDKKTLIYLTTIVSDNAYAVDILTKKRAKLPSYHYFGDYYTFVVMLSPARNFNCGLKILKGSEVGLDKIIKFLNQTGEKKQFYPFYTKEDFSSDSLKDFSLNDLYIAIKDGKIIGLIGKWDQSKFKQVVVRGYKGGMKRFKFIYDALLRMKKYPILPAANSILNFFYISFIAVKDNNREVFNSLLSRIHNDFNKGKYSYFLTGLHNRDPLCKTLVKFPHIKYTSKLYIVCWEDGEEFYRNLDDRIPYLELATL